MKTIGKKKKQTQKPQTDTTIYFKAGNLRYILVELYGIAGICFYDPYRVFLYTSHPHSYIYKQCYKH